MNDFLNEFQMLLEKYNVAIVRSASEKGELVVCVNVPDRPYVDEVSFDEEISSGDILHKHYNIRIPVIF